MASIELTHEVLRALAHGLDRLNDGDLRDRAQVREVEKLLARAGYVVRHCHCEAASEATSGYINGQDAYVRGDGTWSVPVKPGDVLTLDEEGTVPLRVLLYGR